MTFEILKFCYLAWAALKGLFRALQAIPTRQLVNMKPTIALLLACTLLALGSLAHAANNEKAANDDILDYVLASLAGPASAKAKAAVARPANGRPVKKACLKAVTMCDPNESERYPNEDFT